MLTENHEKLLESLHFIDIALLSDVFSSVTFSFNQIMNEIISSNENKTKNGIELHQMYVGIPRWIIVFRD